MAHPPVGWGVVGGQVGEDRGVRVIDLNADLGEGDGPWRLEPSADDALLTLVSSANVAAGFHGGDSATMAATCAAALQRGVAVGAHPSYDDREGFGRRRLDVRPELLRAQVAHQLGALAAVARSVGARVTHVKPHGALYNAVVHDEVQARAVVEAVLAVDPALAVLGLPGSRVLAVARAAGLRIVAEAFVDRGYAPDGTLVPRDRPGALVTDPQAAAARAVQMAVHGTVTAVDGTVVRVDALSLCLHSDTPGAVAIATAVRAALDAAGVEVRPFRTAGEVPLLPGGAAQPRTGGAQRVRPDDVAAPRVRPDDLPAPDPRDAALDAGDAATDRPGEARAPRDGARGEGPAR
ncbi:LamB/YcsF family protein [Cellulomonas sp. zg-ZUI199]|uniref:5-oxoprolinase subunit A n=1 Tax=Cellulomonas wangleii TaxID=2816956 RepID=A0ABX8DA49_9CELL|nr:LamB/YcsF family protein [Cellulomonas wangleii]QVI64310.1 LamB/YcsF family protein [Cellulomonas wangleii]